MTNTTPAHGTNDNRLTDLMKAVGKLGAESMLGKDSLPKLAHAVVRAANDGVIEPDDAKQVFDRYASSAAAKKIHDRPATSTKAQVSKLRQLITMGAMKTVDAVEVMQEAFEIRNALLDLKAKVKSPYPFYVDVAREQLKQDTPLTEKQLQEICMTSPTPKTVQDLLGSMLEALEGIISGENRHDVKDDADATIDAYEALKTRLDQLK